MSDVTKLQAAEPVLITDGNNSTIVMTAQPTGTEGGLVIREAQKGQQTSANSRSVVLASDATLPVLYSNTDTYSVSTFNENVKAATNTVFSAAYLWHPASVSKTYYIQKIVVCTDSGGSTKAAIRIARITAEHGSPGGTLITPASWNGSVSGATFRSYATAAPTRTSVDIFNRPFIGNTASVNIFEFPIDISGPVCRAGVAEGWEVRFDVATPLLNSLRVTIDVIWTEA